MTGQQTRESAPLSERRVTAPPGRRSCEVIESRETGGYRIFSALDQIGPEPLAGQFYMLAAAEGGLRLDFLVEAVGPGTERLAGLRPDECLWVTGPLGRPFSTPHDLAAE